MNILDSLYGLPIGQGAGQQGAGQQGAGQQADGLSQLGQSALSQQYAYLTRQIGFSSLNTNPFSSAKRELTIKEELQAETDKWLEGICI